MAKGIPTFGVEIETRAEQPQMERALTTCGIRDKVKIGKQLDDRSVFWECYNDGGMELTTPIMKSADDAEHVARVVQGLATAGVQSDLVSRGMHFYVGRNDTPDTINPTSPGKTVFSDEKLSQYRDFIKFLGTYQKAFYLITHKNRNVELHEYFPLAGILWMDHENLWPYTFNSEQRNWSTAQKFSYSVRSMGRASGTFGFHRFGLGAIEIRTPMSILEHHYVLGICGLAKQLADHFLGDYITAPKMGRLDPINLTGEALIKQFLSVAGFDEEYGEYKDRDLRRFTKRQLLANFKQFWS